MGHAAYAEPLLFFFFIVHLVSSLFTPRASARFAVALSDITRWTTPLSHLSRARAMQSARIPHLKKLVA